MKIRRGILAAAALLAFAACGSDFTESDLERILVTRSGAVQFWVFQGYMDDNALKCVPLTGARKAVRIAPDRVGKTDFFTGSTEFDLLHGVICALPYRNDSPRHWEVMFELARQMNAMPRAVYRLDENMQKLDRKLAELASDSLSEEQTSQILEDLDSLSDDLCAALDEQKKEQFLLAVAMHMTVARRLDRCRFQSAALLRKLRIILLRKAEKILIAQAGNLYRNQLYQADFAKLFPRTRGQWNAAPPQNWKELQEAWRKSLKSYYELRNYSATADFEAWGGCMLNVLMFTQDMPQAKPLEKQYRDALAEYRKIFAQ